MTARYRRSPYLVAYWERRQLVFENYAAHTRVTSTPLAVAILDLFDRWRPVSMLRRRFPDVAAADAARALAALVDAGLIERSDAPRSRRVKPLARWAAWSPVAALFHFSTKDGHAPESDEGPAWLRDHKLARRPAPIKRYPRAAQVALPRIARGDIFTEILVRRRTWRSFSPQPIARAQMAAVLGLTFGVQQWADVGALGRLALKTSPSGGAQHPIEAYVVVNRVRGVRRGTYHYNAASHRLERLGRRAGKRLLVGYLNGQEWFADAAAVVLMTAVFGRLQWKYPASRAYRAVLIEAGHLCQTFCLTATSLGLAPFCTMALAESRIERDLGIDGVGESVVYAAGVGVPPDNGEGAGPRGRRRPNRAVLAG